MLKRNLTLIVVACGLLAGCEFNRTQMIKMDDRLSTPYQDPQIVVDVKTHRIELDGDKPMKSQMIELLPYLDRPDLMKAELHYPEAWSSRQVSALKKHTQPKAKKVTDVEFKPNKSNQLEIVVHYAVAKVIGCDNTAATPETYDGKTGYSPNHACATLKNKVAMVADPRDFLQGKSYENNSSVQGVSAVEAFNQGSVAPLQAQAISAGEE